MERENKEKDKALEYQQVRGKERQAEIDRIREREKYYRRKSDREQDKRPTDVQDIESDDADDEREKMRQEGEKMRQEREKMRQEREKMRKEVIELQYRNDGLVAEMEENEVVELYDEEKRCYTTETQKYVHRLLTNNVATNRVGAVITDILELAGKKTQQSA